MICQVWNKKDSIKGIDAQYYINNFGILDTDEVFLVMDNGGHVSCLEITRIIKSVYGLDITLTTEQVMAEYIKIKELENNNNPTITEQLQNKISILESENETLKASIQATQQAVDFMVMNGGI